MWPRMRAVRIMNRICQVATRYLSGVADNVEFKVLNDPRTFDWRLLIESFLNLHINEPVASALPGFNTEQGRKNMEIVLQSTYEGINAPLVVAWDNDRKKVAGFSLNQIVHRNESADVGNLTGFSKCTWDDIPQQHLDEFFKFWAKCDGVSVADIYGEEKCWVMLLGAICPEYGQGAIGHRMMLKCLEVAKDAGFKVTAAHFSSIYSQSIGAKCGFEKILELEYKEEFALHANIREDLRKHKSCLIAGKRL